LPDRYIGRTLGKYRIDELIGSGGFAWVYKAFDPELDIPVALKILKPQYGGDPKFEQRFRREASTAAKLRHPNIVTIFAVGSEDGAVYFAMDFLPGALADKLDVMGTIPESMLVRTGIDVASALAFAHREGIIHRDIKIDNIMFDDHGNAVVADFGIAKAVSGYVGETGTDMVVGTPQYFSPEQARALPLDGRADIYSLGVTLFKAATGALPFNGTDWYEIARQHVEEKPPKPRSLNSAISKEFERVILRCMEKDPADRYPTGEAMCEELVTLLKDMGESPPVRTLQMPATNPSTSDSIRARLGIRQRHVKQLKWAIPAALAAMIIIPVAWKMSTKEPPPPPRTTNGPPRGTAPAVTTPRPPTPKQLVVNAPTGAVVKVNDVEVGKGDWRSDTLPAGSYTITAAVDSKVANCPSVSSKRTITLLDTGRVSVTLNPRGCGMLAITGAPRGATYEITSRSNPTVRGAISATRPVLLPVGTYQLQVRFPRCTEFTGSVKVENDKTTTQRTPLLCG
jgi:serine/threonine protein kinase